jgi:hypothetical protein
MALLTRFIGIDYSGAGTAQASLPGLRLYMASLEAEPAEVSPIGGKKRRNWSRQEMAVWLAQRLQEPIPTLIGIDHSLSFPVAYFDRYQLPYQWDYFLDDFVAHWPADQEPVESIRQRGSQRNGEARWRRLTEVRAGGAKSVFHFDVPGSVAKSTHAGLPWIRTLRRQFGPALHCWPFDGWSISPGRSVICEVYPSRMRSGPPPPGWTADQHDAWSVTSWMRHHALAGTLSSFFTPSLTAAEHPQATIEGWILGIL